MNQVRILTDAVDDITTVDDFLAVSENHILEDVNACVASLQVRILLIFSLLIQNIFVLLLKNSCSITVLHVSHFCCYGIAWYLQN